MKVVLPKEKEARELRKAVFPELLLIELNDFDIDVFLPGWFFKILAGGRERRNQTNDPKNIVRYIKALANQTDVSGFDDDAGQKVLERLVRTALIVTRRQGNVRNSEQIVSTVPYTLLDHKPGLNASRGNRRADTFIYRALLNKFDRNERELRNFIKKVFAHGVEIPPQEKSLGGEYDGKTELDTLTRLSLSFLRGFDTIGFKGQLQLGNAKKDEEEDKPRPPACPGLERKLADEIIAFLQTYHERMPTQGMIYYLHGLLNLELFNYTLKLIYAVNELVGDPSRLPAAMSEGAQIIPPQIYLDFTGGNRGLNFEMARACVRRDIEAYQKFVRSNLLLFHLHRYIKSLHDGGQRERLIVEYTGDGRDVPQMMQGMLRLITTEKEIGSEVMAAARIDIMKIKAESLGEQQETEATRAALNFIYATAQNDLERLVALTTQAQQSVLLAKHLRWFTGTGGLHKPHGIMSMSGKDRRVWRYAPSNDFLGLLVQLAAANRPIENQPLRLRDFLNFIYERFGIIVDRPPAPFEGAEYTAAARANLNAMLGRLRQMGIFRDLSDDFTVQELYPPYLSSNPEKMPANNLISTENNNGNDN